MVDGFAGFAVFVGLGLVSLAGLRFVHVVGGRSSPGSHTALAGLFPARGGRDWPTGVQESDVPRFDVTHLDALRPGTVARSEPALSGSEPPTEGRSVEIVELVGSARFPLERIDSSAIRERRPARRSPTPGATGRDPQVRPDTRP